MALSWLFWADSAGLELNSTALGDKPEARVYDILGDIHTASDYLSNGWLACEQSSPCGFFQHRTDMALEKQSFRKKASV